MAKTGTWIAVIAVILLLSAAASLLLFSRPAAGHTAEIYVDGGLYKRVDLSRITSPERIEVKTERGVNVLLAEPGRIRVESADCPDKVCVEAGWLASSAAPIVCLPHRVVVKLTGDTALDAEAG